MRITRMRAIVDVAVEASSDERIESSPRFRMTAAQRFDSCHGSIDAERPYESFHVIERHIALRIQMCGIHANARPREWREKFVAARHDFRPQRSRGDLAALRCDVDRHDDIAFDLDDAPSRFCRNVFAPRPLWTEIATVADEECRALRARDRDVIGCAAPNDEPNAARFDSACGFGQAL